MILYIDILFWLNLVFLFKIFQVLFYLIDVKLIYGIVID